MVTLELDAHCASLAAIRQKTGWAPAAPGPDGPAHREILVRRIAALSRLAQASAQVDPGGAVRLCALKAHYLAQLLALGAH